MGVAQDIEKLAAPLLAQAGFELVDIEYRREPIGWVLRFYIDKPGGISLDDCADWTNRLERIVEGGNLIPHGYSLEVSSPGLARPLKKPDDFKRYLGIEAVVKLFAAQKGQKNFHGKLVGVEGEDLLLFDRTSGSVKIPFASIASARLDPAIEI